MKKIIIILTLFFLDRVSKIYLLNLQSTGIDIDFYIYPFLNFYLVWNSGIGFGLASMEANIYYHILTIIIVFVNIALIFFLIKYKGIYSYLIAVIVGGSLGNLFDRIYYYAVPDFIDLHIGNYHWFIFNIADIFITVGIIGLILIELFKKKKYKKMFKKIILITVMTSFIASCGDTLSSVKRGLTGEKANSTDEFLIQKKDPLILPPDFENLPTPDEKAAAVEDVLSIERELESSIENNSSSSTSLEESVLKKNSIEINVQKKIIFLIIILLTLVRIIAI